MNWIYKSFIGITFLLIIVTAGLSREKNKYTYQLENGSRLWINGSATLGSYECRTIAVFGTGKISHDSSDIAEHPTGPDPDSGIKIAVMVKLLDCGNRAMNKDMFKALRADSDSLILYKLIDARIKNYPASTKKEIELRTIGDLTIAGITRRDTIDTEIRILKDGKYEIVGEKTLSMRDFDIIPPTAFFGLIKADEKLVVGFDLIAGPVGEYKSSEDSLKNEGN